MKKKNIVLIYIIQVIILIGLLFIGYNIINANIKSNKADKKRDNEEADYKDLPLNELQKEIGSILDSISSTNYTLYLDLYSGKKEKHIVIYHSDNIEKIDIVNGDKIISNYIDYSSKKYYVMSGSSYNIKSIENDSFISYLKKLFNVYAYVNHEENNSYYSITFYNGAIKSYVNSTNNLLYLDGFVLKVDKNYNCHGSYVKEALINNIDGYQFDIHTGKNDYMTITITDVGLDNNISLPN